MRFNNYLSSFKRNEISEYCLNFKSDFLKSTFNNKTKSVCVALYTCEKYLESRVKSCFSTWFKKLDNEKFIFVGSNENKKIDSEFNNFIVNLKVNDDYESLPQKTLALIEWFLKILHLITYLKLMMIVM